MSQINYINLAGLAFDIAGAILLGRALISMSTQKIADQVSTAWDFNKHLIASVIEASLDARVGLGMLVCGFVLQGASAFRSGEAWTLVLAIAAIAAIWSSYKLLLPKLVQKQEERVMDYIQRRHEAARPSGVS